MCVDRLDALSTNSILCSWMFSLLSLLFSSFESYRYLWHIAWQSLKEKLDKEWREKTAQTMCSLDFAKDPTQ